MNTLKSINEEIGHIRLLNYNWKTSRISVAEKVEGFHRLRKLCDQREEDVKSS